MRIVFLGDKRGCSVVFSSVRSWDTCVGAEMDIGIRCFCLILSVDFAFL
jgi:hypothetical protein